MQTSAAARAGFFRTMSIPCIVVMVLANRTCSGRAAVGASSRRREPATK